MFYISDLPLIILQLYFRFIRGHSIVHAIITGQCVAQTVCNIWSCACERGYTQGWLERWILLPYVSWCFHHCWISAQFGFVYFYIGAFSTPYTFGIILRTPLRSWGFLFQFLLSDVFPEEAPNLSENSLTAPTRARSSVLSDLLRIIHFCLSVSDKLNSQECQLRSRLFTLERCDWFSKNINNKEINW